MQSYSFSYVDRAAYQMAGVLVKAIANFIKVLVNCYNLWCIDAFAKCLIGTASRRQQKQLVIRHRLISDESILSL